MLVGFVITGKIYSYNWIKKYISKKKEANLASFFILCYIIDKINYLWITYLRKKFSKEKK